MSELDEIEARAQRHLDGMKVSTERLARDTLRLCRTLRKAKDALDPKRGPPKKDWLDDLFKL